MRAHRKVCDSVAIVLGIVERADAEEHAQQAELRAAFAFADVGGQRVGCPVEHAAAEADREHAELHERFDCRRMPCLPATRRRSSDAPTSIQR